MKFLPLFPISLITITCLGLLTSQKEVQAATFNFSGFSITDSRNSNSYEAEGSFDLPDGFSGNFDINTPNIPTSLNVTVNTISGLNADFTYNPSNIVFGSSIFTGTVTGQTASFQTISLITNSFVLLIDNTGQQDYGNFDAGLTPPINTVMPNVSGTSFNDATIDTVPIPEPVSILGSLVALGLGTILKSSKKEEC